MDVEDVKWTIGAENCHIHFNNLFGGDKILGKTVVRRVQVVTPSALLHFPLFLSSALPLTTVFLRFCAFFIFPHYILFPQDFLSNSSNYTHLNTRRCVSCGITQCHCVCVSRRDGGVWYLQTVGTQFQRHSVKSQKTWILDKTAALTSNYAPRRPSKIDVRRRCS